jgi:UDP-glucose 4-epimerase
MQRVLVIGADGYLGRSLAERLQKSCFEVMPVVRDPSEKDLDKLFHKFISADLRDRSSLFKLASNGDLIINAAGLVGTSSCAKNPEAALEVNSYGVSNLGYVCREMNTDLIHISSVATIGEPQSLPLGPDHPRNPLDHYGLTKLLGERSLEVLANDSFSCLVPLLTNVYGYSKLRSEKSPCSLIELFVDKALVEKKISVHSPGTQARDFIHINDVSDALIEMVRRSTRSDYTGYQPFLVGSGESHSIYSAAAIVQEEVQRRTQHEVDIEIVEDSENVGVRTEEYNISLDFLLDKIGFPPSVSLRQGVVQLVEQKVTAEG